MDASGTPGRPAGREPRRGWRRFDTLFLRLFVLLWVTLLASTILGFEAFRVSRGALPADAREPARARADVPLMPGLPPAVVPGASPRQDGPPPDLPPPGALLQDAGPPDRPPAPPPEPAPPRAPHGLSLWLDMAVRVLVIGLAAAWAARWMSAPIRRLGEAAGALRATFAGHAPGAFAAMPPQVDASRGSVEVRATAQVFNEMSRQLKADFDAQRLLLATVSHDLRTPLARLRLRLEALDADGADTTRAVEDVRQMDELLEGLLDLFRSAPDAPAARVATSRTEALSLVQALVDDLPPGSPEVAITGSAAVVACAPLALRRMVQNLLGNAMRHSDAVGVDVATVVADDAPGSPPGVRVRIRIDDHGPGLSPEQLAIAGTPFLHWAAASTQGTRDAPAPASAAEAAATSRAGLGLGLHIARALAEHAGGRLVLGTRPGGGLRADLLLPTPHAPR